VDDLPSARDQLRVQPAYHLQRIDRRRRRGWFRYTPD
jgi:hypothetical protein